MVSIAKRKEILTARLAELEERLQGIEQTLVSHEEQDWEDMAIEHEGDEVLEGMGNSGLAEIEKIRAALQRIEAGEYGYCVICGDEISSERLDVLPATPFCRRCAS